jgi:predicted DCC family thiol-disulfide oxidoreductase YuxK
MSEKHWLLFDGDCDMCRRSAAWVRRRDMQRQFEIVAYQSAPSPPMTPTLAAACEKAIHVVRADGTILRAGRACLFILERIGWGRWARLLTVPPFLWLVELGYWIVARNRSFFARFLFRRELPES